jgi:hypothetical protein
MILIGRRINDSFEFILTLSNLQCESAIIYIQPQGFIVNTSIHRKPGSHIPAVCRRATKECMHQQL